MAVVAVMPSASDKTAIAVEPGLRSRYRMAYRTSCIGDLSSEITRPGMRTTPCAGRPNHLTSRCSTGLSNGIRILTRGADDQRPYGRHHDQNQAECADNGGAGRQVELDREIHAQHRDNDAHDPANG